MAVGVRRPLRLPDNELATDQLDAVARLEDTHREPSYCKRVQRLVGMGVDISPT